MIALLTIAALLVVVALLAPRYGVDSHTSDGWTRDPGAPAPHTRATVRGDLHTLGAGLLAALRAPVGPWRTRPQPVLNRCSGNLR